MKKLSSLIILVLLLAPSPSVYAQERNSLAEEFQLHINGIALHFDKGENTNEWNWGLGIQRSLNNTGSDKTFLAGWKKFWEFDIYKDSFSGVAVAGGIGTQRPILSKLDFGLKVGLVYEKGLKDKDDVGSPVLPYLLPFVETTFDAPVNVRATLIPPVPAWDIGGHISLQLVIKH